MYLMAATQSTMEFSICSTSKTHIGAKLPSRFVSKRIPEKTSNLCQPKTLFLTAIEFVVNHLLSVESFSTLPDIVGEEIFKVALHSKQLDRPGVCIKRLQLFTTAYKAKVLESLTVKERRPVLDDYYLELKLFLNIRELDVSCCGIDDNHSFLVHVGTQLCQLEKLHLGNNCLTDKGVQTLTACSRMMGYGLTNLAYLDLSGNAGISDKAVMYMKCFNQLSRLNLSNCNISESGKASIANQLNLTPCEVSINEPLDEVINKGWAAPLIDRWSSLNSGLCPLHKPSKSAEKFYSKKHISARKMETVAVSYKNLVFLRHDLCQVKQSWTEIDPLGSGVICSVSKKCHETFSGSRFDTTDAGTATGTKRQSCPCPTEAQRKRTKYLIEGSPSIFPDVNLTEWYYKRTSYKECPERRSGSSQIERVVECERRCNPFGIKFQKKASKYSSADCVGLGKCSVADSLNFNILPSKNSKGKKSERVTDFLTQYQGKDFTAHNMTKNSMSPGLTGDCSFASTVENSLAYSLGENFQAINEVEDSKARHMTEHSQVYKSDSQVMRHQKTYLKGHKRTKLKIVKENHPIRSEFTEASQDYSLKNSKQIICLDDQQIRRSLFDFLE